MRTGWPDPVPKTERVRTRFFADAQLAADWIRNLRKFPRHHRLLGVWRTTLRAGSPIGAEPTVRIGVWEEIDPDSDLPAPREEQDYEQNA
jgi:hypothetical protein